MADTPRRKFTLLPDDESWKLSRDDRLQNLKVALSAKRPAKLEKPNFKKHA